MLNTHYISTLNIYHFFAIGETVDLGFCLVWFERVEAHTVKHHFTHYHQHTDEWFEIQGS